MQVGDLIRMKRTAPEFVIRHVTGILLKNDFHDGSVGSRRLTLICGTGLRTVIFYPSVDDIEVLARYKDAEKK